MSPLLIDSPEFIAKDLLRTVPSRTGVGEHRGTHALLVTEIKNNALGAADALTPTQRDIGVTACAAHEIGAPRVKCVDSIKRDRKCARSRISDLIEVGGDFALARRADGDRAFLSMSRLDHGGPRHGSQQDNE